MHKSSVCLPGLVAMHPQWTNTPFVLLINNESFKESHVGENRPIKVDEKQIALSPNKADRNE